MKSKVKLLTKPFKKKPEDADDVILLEDENMEPLPSPPEEKPAPEPTKLIPKLPIGSQTPVNKTILKKPTIIGDQIPTTPGRNVQWRESSLALGQTLTQIQRQKSQKLSAERQGKVRDF